VQRAAMALLVGGGVFLATFSGEAGAAPPDVDVGAQQRLLVVVVPVDYEPQIRGAVILAESIRAFGGELAAVPIRLYAPAQLGSALAAKADALSRLGVDVRTFQVPPSATGYLLGAKPFAAAQAEREVGDHRLLAVLAPNTIVLRPPTAFLLPATTKLGYSTVHHRNIGSLASEPPDPLWSRVYAVLGVDQDRVFTNRTLADEETVRFYFNAGSFVVRPEHGLLKRWAEAFQLLIEDAAIAEMCAEGPRNTFLHQAALAGAALASLRPAEVVRLPDTYSYPLFFERFHGGLLKFDSLANVVTMRCEFRPEDLPEGWTQQVEGPPEVLAWIKGRLEEASP